MQQDNNIASHGAALERIGILGAGAMGTLFAARLASSGTDVTLVDIDDPLLETLQREGARCITDAGLLHAPVHAVRAGQMRQQSHHNPDLWLVFTKSVHTGEALKSIAHLVHPGTHFLSLQNGIGHADTLQAVASANRVAIGITTWPARVISPGQVSSRGEGSIHFMPCSGEAGPMFTQLAHRLNLAGLNCQIDPQVQQAIWEKLAFNAAFNGICGLTQQTVDGLANPIGEGLIDQVLREVLAIAHAHGVDASAERVNAAVRNALEHHQGHQPSMLQDLLAGRPTETDAIHGAVLQVADRLGIEVPVTRTLHQLLSLCRRPHTAPDPP